MLCQVDAALGQGKAIEDICREQGISPASGHLWKQKYGGLSIQDAKRLKERNPFEIQNICAGRANPVMRHIIPAKGTYGRLVVE